MLIQKYTHSITFTVTEDMADELMDAAQLLNVTRSDIIRACIYNDLPKLKDRERKRKNSRKNSRKHRSKTSHR